MIRTFEELFEKLEVDRKCRTVPEDRVKKARRVGVNTQEAEEADSAVDWMLGYLFCLVDVGYIREEEKESLVDLLLDMRYG